MNFRIMLISLALLGCSSLIKSADAKPVLCSTESVRFNLERDRIYDFSNYLKYKKFDLNKVKNVGLLERIPPVVSFEYEGKIYYVSTIEKDGKFYCVF